MSEKRNLSQINSPFVAKKKSDLQVVINQFDWAFQFQYIVAIIDFVLSKKVTHAH